jgi:hypothetical protein
MIAIGRAGISLLTAPGADRGSAGMDGDTGVSFLTLAQAGAPVALGLCGILLNLGSYLCLQLGLIRGNGWLYPGLNLVAGSFVAYALWNRVHLFSLLGEITWATISLIGLVRLYVVHKYFSLTDDEQAAAARLVPGLAKDRVRKLLALGAWRDEPPGTVLTRKGEPTTHLVYVADGLCHIELDGALVATIGPGGLIAELTYASGEPATATVIVETPSRILAFDRGALDGFLRRNDDIRIALEQSVAGDLRHKLAVTTRALADDRLGGRAAT